MAAVRGGAMVVRTGKRSSWRSRGRNQARRGSGSDDTSDEDYQLGVDGEEDEVSSEGEEDEVGELEVSDDDDEEEGDETGSDESELGDKDEDFVINPVRKKRTPKPNPKQVKKKDNNKTLAKRKRGVRETARNRRSGLLPRVCEEGEEDKKGVDSKAPREGVRKRRVFGGGDEYEDGEDRDDVDFSPEDEEEEDDFDDEELEDEGEDEVDLEDDDDEEDESSNDEEDDLIVEVSEKRRHGSGKNRSSGKALRGGGRKRKQNVRKSKSGLKKRKRSKARSVPKKRKKAFISSGDDDEDDDEDFVVEDDDLLVDDDEEVEEEEDETGRIRKAPRSRSGGNAAVQRRPLLPFAYDSAATDSYSSGFDDDDDPISNRGAGRRTARLVQMPRTGLCCRSRQKQQHKGKGKAQEEDLHPQQQQQQQQDEEEDPPEKRICGVCLSEERKGHIIGVLNSCAHFFCFACILEWSKVESRCPVCKQRFTAVTKSSGSDLAIQLRPIVVSVPKRDQVYQPSEEEVRGYLDPYANVVCIECQQGGEDTLMLLCDLCNSAAHTYCVGLGREVPEGDWYCDACRAADYEPPPNAQDQQDRNQEQQAVLTTGLELQQHGSNSASTRAGGTGRVEIDMNVPYVPSPERLEEDVFADEGPPPTMTPPYFRTAPDLSQSTAQLHPQQDAVAATRQPRSARQPASTVSERRALHQRIHSMYWLNVNQFMRQLGSEDRRQQQQQPPQQSVPFDDLNTALTRDFL